MGQVRRLDEHVLLPALLGCLNVAVLVVGYQVHLWSTADANERGPLEQSLGLFFAAIMASLICLRWRQRWLLGACLVLHTVVLVRFFA